MKAICFEDWAVFQVGTYRYHQLVKIFREDEEGNEYFMYYLQPSTSLCAFDNLRGKASNKPVKAEAYRRITAPLEYMDKRMKTYPN